MSLSEQEFRVKSDEALDAARHALLPLADSDGFEVELQNGVLNLVFEEPIDDEFIALSASSGKSFAKVDAATEIRQRAEGPLGCSRRPVTCSPRCSA
jgi:hypothetical protein